MVNTGKLICKHLVIKIASRCNLNCSYCYMYNMGDSTYKNQPKFMSKEVILSTIKEVKNHCIENDLDEFTFVFHGGEPLLASPKLYEFFVNNTKEILPEGIKTNFKLQTNGMLITKAWCELFEKLNIGIGISLDGDKNENDKYRLDHKGNGSFDAIIKGYATANTYLNNKPGIVTFINIGTNPLTTYNFLKSIEIGYVDFILPDGTHNTPRWDSLLESQTPYADWLIKIFDLWFLEKGQKPKIRFFETIMMLILGRGTDEGNDALGVGSHQVLVIETDGGIEPIDSLKVCGNGFTKINANILTSKISDAFDKELAQLCNLSHKLLCKQCMNCPVKNICGGGYLAHRFSNKNGFNNPSIYCNDLLKLITHIQNVVFGEIPTHLFEELNLQLVRYEEAQLMIEQKNAISGEPEWTDYLMGFRNKSHKYV
ncbi:radical SAM protein [Pedobacter sp. R20-19]|uniref:radical SAM protein n=1 Tax=Pedobacter sp. R20-19 TaxID=1270196 RepID=UPI0009E9BFC6|nr:radical SAM protein [Pedobacter sp. R20-19]